MSHIFTKENITFALSIFGSLGTLFTLIHTFLINRKQLQMRVNGHVFGDAKKMIVLYVSFANKSRLPISVTDICIKIDDTYYPCLQPPIIAYEETKKVNGAVVSHRAISSLSIPINISSLSGTSGYICFEFPEVSFPSNATELTFSVSSNRGKVFEKKLPLGRPLH